MYINTSFGQLLMILRVVYQFGQLFETQLLTTLTENELYGIDHVGFPGAVRSNDRRETLVERSNLPHAGIGLEILQHHLCNN